MCHLLMLNRRYRYLEVLMSSLLFLWLLTQFALRFFELYALLAFELLISTLVVLAKKMLSLASYQSETKNWNVIVSWIIFRRNHWELKACIRAILFFDIDTIIDSVQDFVENSWHHWIVWSLNQSRTSSNWRNRYLDENWKNRSSKTMKISSTSQRFEKNADLLDNWVKLSRILKHDEKIQYRVLRQIFRQKILVVSDAMILSSILKRKKRDSLQMKQIWFRNILDKDE